MTVNVHDPETSQQKPMEPGFSLFNLGFRPFFLLAGIFAVLSMGLWALIYPGILAFDHGQLTPFQWHGHEMIFGYTTAVIAGFLLTSVKTWTGQQTAAGKQLGLIVVFWLVARLCFAIGGDALLIGALFNMAFLLTFVVNIGEKIVRVRQWRQAGIMVVVSLLTLGELGFVIGLIQQNQLLLSKALYAAFYLVIMLILIMGRRVVPFFIERGVGYPLTLKQSGFLDRTVIGGFVAYAVCSLANVNFQLIAALAAWVFVCQTLRLINWYSGGMWKKPLLWSLYIALLVIDLGFLMAALAPWVSISSYLILHAFAVGGIGFITLSMMSRVALGHTGRSVHEAPALVRVSLLLMVIAIVARVILPLFWPENYGLWVGVAQAAWIGAFALFIVVYAPILTKPRVDSQPG